VTATASGQTASVTFTVVTPQLDKVIIPGLTADVSVTYDQFDIPHIFCAVPADCFAVQGYLQAQDRLFQMDLFRRTAEGKLAALVGSVESDQDKLFKRFFITRDLDRIEHKLVLALSPEVKAGVNAYTAGVNAYLAFLAANPAQMPQEYAQLPGVIAPSAIPPWTAEDTLAIGRLQQFQLSETIEKETGYGLFALTSGPPPAPHSDAARFGAYVLPVQPVNGFTLSATDSSTPSAGLRASPPPAVATPPAGTAAALGKINARCGAELAVRLDPRGLGFQQLGGRGRELGHRLLHGGERPAPPAAISAALPSRGDDVRGRQAEHDRRVVSRDSGGPGRARGTRRLGCHGRGLRRHRPLSGAGRDVRVAVRVLRELPRRPRSDLAAHV
jgi:hypothetical protein